LLGSLRKKNGSAVRCAEGLRPSGKIDFGKSGRSLNSNGY
jgi:hypothetical protein